MRKFFSSVTFKILIGIVAALTGLMVYSASNSDSVSFAEKVLTVVTTPFQKAAAGISSAVSTGWSNLTSGGRLRAENEELREEIDRLKDKLVDFETYKNENERLKALLEISEENEELSLVSADVIARDTDDYGTSFTISRGKKHGVEERDAVITSSGLVGVVTEVFPTSARVTTVLSTDIQLGAQVVRTRDTGVCTGVTSWALASNLKLSYISRDSAVSAGDMVVTSGASGIYPPNLIIGEVVSVEAEQNGTSLYAVVKATEDMDSLKNVYVVTDFSEGEK